MVVKGKLQLQLLQVFLIAALCGVCSGHGHMTLPPSRNGGTIERAADCLHGECMYFSQPCEIPGEPTNNAAASRTFNVDVSSGPHDFTRKNPWRAPGSALLVSGCGRAGGGPVRTYNGGTAKEFGLQQNMDGSALPVVERRVWRRGETAEVAWAVNANHGGGYAYRLCALPGNGSSQAISEQCFQQGHLDFAGSTSWIQWQQTWAQNHSQTSRVEIPRVTVSNGTFPAGSQWARVPIPACQYTGSHFGWSDCANSDCAGCCATHTPLPPHPRINASWWRSQDCIAMCAANGLPGSCPPGEVQFPEPLPGLSSLWSSWLWCDAPNKTAPHARASSGKPTATAATAHGHGQLADSPHDMPCSHASMMKVNIVDQVIVPKQLEPGNYLLSWRWDAEQTNQIWANCGDVQIV